MPLLLYIIIIIIILQCTCIYQLTTDPVRFCIGKSCLSEAHTAGAVNLFQGCLIQIF